MNDHLALFLRSTTVTFVWFRVGESSVLRPSCCGVTPWLIILPNSSPESLFVWPAHLVGCSTKTSTRLSLSPLGELALVNASGPQIEVRRCLSRIFPLIACCRICSHAHSTAAVPDSTGSANPATSARYAFVAGWQGSVRTTGLCVASCFLGGKHHSQFKWSRGAKGQFAIRAQYRQVRADVGR